MKKIFTLLMVFIAFNSYAQLASLGYKMTDDYERFLASTTYVVLTDNAAYDSNMVHAIKKYWKITPYKFINYKKDLNKKIRDKKASFLLLVNMSTEESEDLYNCLALINGGKPTLAGYEFIDMLASSPTNHFLNELHTFDCSYRVQNMVQSIIATLDIVQKEQYKGDLEKVRSQLIKYYRTKSGAISKRILLICPEIIGDKIDEADFKKMYPYQTEFCKKETIDRIIASGDSSFYYLQLGATGTKSVFVFDPSNGEVVYADYSSGKFFSKDDLKDLSKTIEQLSKDAKKKE
jgi:hypothetical protein